MDIYEAISKDNDSVLSRLSDIELPDREKLLNAIFANHAENCLLHMINRFNLKINLSDLVKNDWISAYDLLMDYEALNNIEENFGWINENDRADCSLDSLAYLLYAIKNNCNEYVEFFLANLTSVQDIMCINAPYLEILSPCRAIIAISDNEVTTSLDLAVESGNYQAFRLIIKKLKLLIKDEDGSYLYYKALAILEANDANFNHLPTNQAMLHHI